jgi:hypothetical protein
MRWIIETDVLVKHEASQGDGMRLTKRWFSETGEER